MPIIGNFLVPLQRFLNHARKDKMEKTLSQKLQMLRKSKHCSQKVVADAIGVSKPYYCRLESGDRDIQEKHLERIATYYGENIEELKSMKLADTLSSIIQDYPLTVVNKAFDFLKK